MFNVARFIRERKKFIFLSALVYLITQFVYTSRWQLRTVITKPASSVGSLLVQMWNANELNEASALIKDIRIDRQTFSVAERRLKTFGDREKPLVAIGCGITSKKLPAVNGTRDLASSFQFFHTLLETFCKTADRVRFNYVFYVAYDSVDPFFSNQSLADDFRRTFDVEIGRLCGAGTGGESKPTAGERTPALVASIHLVPCSDNGKPTRAQNDAMVAAYVDGADFFYRVNDDTKMVTGNWTRQFIAVLDGYDPPRVGVVGPNHWGGNMGILTYDFVHRTHVDVLGFYYPYLFTDWWGDDWMTSVYKPNRSTKMHNIQLTHTMTLGRRYVVNYAVGGQVAGQLAIDKITIARYVDALKAGKLARKRSDRKVISMSLYGSEPRYTWGAIRNAQLLPVYLPDWTLRVYVPATSLLAPTDLPSSSTSPSVNMAVRPAVIETLRWLGAEIAWVPDPVSGNDSHLSPRDWRLLAADDSNVDFLLIRDADHRLTDRESTSIDEWIAAAESSGSDDVGAIHCFRDHPKHAVRALTDGLWGGRPAALRRYLKHSLVVLFARSITHSNSNETAGNIVLNDVVWSAMKDLAFCHDAVSPCGMWPPYTSRHAFPPSSSTVTGQRQQYVGQKFDTHEIRFNSDFKDLPKTEVQCDGSVQLLITTTTNEISTGKTTTSTSTAASTAAAAASPLSSAASRTPLK